jgi:hypothetical protein
MATRIVRAVSVDTSELPRLAVVPFQLRESTSESDADVLAQILAINIVSSGAYAVYPRTATLEQVQAEYDNQLSGDTADENLVDMGKGEKPLFVLSGTARKLGATRNMFNASIIDLGSGVQRKGASVNTVAVCLSMAVVRLRCAAVPSVGIQAACLSMPVTSRKQEEPLTGPIQREVEEWRLSTASESARQRRAPK